MKIVKVSTHVMGVVLPRNGVDAVRRNWIFVRVETDEGIERIGEATTENYEHAVASMIEQHFGPFLIGKDPTKITRACQSRLILQLRSMPTFVQRQNRVST